MKIYCENKKCIWCKTEVVDALGQPPPAAPYICTRQGLVLHIDGDGNCALFVRRTDASVGCHCPKCEHARENKITSCPWPCSDMYPHAGRNFCPSCGRDLRGEKR